MNRRGYALIELIAVISVSMITLGIAAGLVHSAFDVERSLRERLAQRQVVDRLAEQFRRDVHAASEVIVEADPIRCELVGHNRASVVYRTEGAMLVREALGEEGSSSSQHASRTDFPLPQRCTVVFDRFEQAGRTLVGLTIVPKPGPDAPARQAPQPVRIDALLDRHSIVAGAQLPPVEPSGDMP